VQVHAQDARINLNCIRNVCVGDPRTTHVASRERVYAKMRASVLHCSHARLFQVLRACVSECVCCVLLCLVLFFIVLQLLSVGWSGDSGILAHLIVC